MQRIYAIDLCDLWRGKLSLRKLRVLIEHLPGDCASARAFAEITGPLASWSLTDALLGRVADELTAFRWQWESSHIDPKKARPRNAPESVLPRDVVRDSASADVPVVSPHRLGGFINRDDDEGGEQ